MSKNGDEFQTTVFLIILVLLLLFISLDFLQDFERRASYSSSNEIQSENEIKNFSIPEIIYKSFADIQKILRNKEIEKECTKDFYELSSTIYCRRRFFSYER